MKKQGQFRHKPLPAGSDFGRTGMNLFDWLLEEGFPGVCRNKGAWSISAKELDYKARKAKKVSKVVKQI